MKNNIVKNRILEDETGYRFYIYPTNNNNQELGKSIYYNTYQECCDGLKNFKKFIETNSITDFNSHFIKIEKADNKYNYELLDENGLTIFTNSRLYWQKAGCKNGIKSVCTNIRKKLIIDSLSVQ